MVCTCYTRGGVKALMSYQLQELVLQFLIGLNDSFAQVRAQVLMLDPLPSINKVFSLIVQEERHRSINNNEFLKGFSSDSQSINTVGSTNYSRHPYRGSKDRDMPKCTYCGAVGHVVDNCFKLHGYPPLGYGQRFKDNGKAAINQSKVGK